MKTTKLNPILSLALAGGMLSACGSDYEFPNDKEEPNVPVVDKREEAFVNAAGGPIDPKHTWIMDSVVKFSVATRGTCHINVYSSGEPVRECFFKQTVTDHGDFSVSLPQGYDDDLLVECIDSNGEYYYQIVDDDDFGKTINIDFASKMSGSTRAVMTRAGSFNPNLAAQTGIKSWGYRSFSGNLWSTLVEDAATEGKRKDPDSKDYSVNFKLVSRGPFYIAFAYGDTGNRRDLLFGFYHYKEGDLSTFDFIPVSEVLKHDYFYNEGETAADAQAKLQYSIDGTWYDTNFDYYDTPNNQNHSNLLSYRRNDGVYKAYYNYQQYGKDKLKLDAVRGLMYQIDVPEGEIVGFYVSNKWPDNRQSHIEKLIKMGIREDVVRDPNKFYSDGLFSEARFNENQKSFSGLMNYYDGFIFMGLDDTPGGDCDCNDVTFCLVPGGDGILPGVYFPYVIDQGNPSKPDQKPLYYNPDRTKTEEPTDTEYLGKTVPWTFAFEDMPTSSDFDFNDVVLEVVDNEVNGKQQVEVYLCAAGGKLPTSVWFKDQCICPDVHKVMGQMTNTGAETTKADVLLTTLKFEGLGKYDIGANARDFKIKVKDGDIERTIDIDTRAQEGSMAPLELVMRYPWVWPTEGTSIFDAYKRFGGFVTDSKDPNYLNWYLAEHITDGLVTKHNRNGKPVKK